MYLWTSKVLNSWSKHKSWRHTLSVQGGGLMFELEASLYSNSNHFWQPFISTMYNTYNNIYVVYFFERKLVYAFGIFAHSLISSKRSNLIDWYRYREYIWSYVCQTSVEIIILTKPNDAKKNTREWKLVGERSVNRGCFFCRSNEKILVCIDDI